LELFKLPRDLGIFEEKKVDASIGRFGPYVRHNNKFYSLKKGIDDPYSIELERAIELILEKRTSDSNKSIQSFEGPEGEIQVLNGRFGAYIAYNKQNFRIPKDKVAKDLTLEECLDIIKNTTVKPARKKGK